MKKLLLVLLLSAFSTFGLSASANAQEPKIKYKDLKFYESKDSLSPAEQVHRIRFPRSKVRRIYVYLEVTNLLYQKKNDVSVIRAKYKKPDGGLFAEIDGTLELNSAYQGFYFTQGLGWDVPGKWETGSYYVELSADGQPIPGGSFIIYDDSVSSDNSPDAVYRDFMLNTIQFYGGNQSEPAENVWDLNGYTLFNGNTAEYIWCRIVVRNLNTAAQHKHKVNWKYFGPDGKLLGILESGFVMDPSKYLPWVEMGWGPGRGNNWKAGRYRVEIFIDDKKAGQDWFNVYSGPFNEDEYWDFDMLP